MSTILAASTVVLVTLFSFSNAPSTNLVSEAETIVVSVSGSGGALKI